MHEKERNLGPQPLGDIMAQHALDAKALVAASTEQITHKMVARAVKGRRLTRGVMDKIVRALSAAAERDYTAGELFTYRP